MIPFAGPLIDRLNRPNLITISNSWLFKITFSLRVLTIFGWISVFHLFVFALMSGIVQTVNQTLRQVLVFDLVPRSLTPNAVAVVQTGWSLMRSFGPAIGGFLIVWYGAGGNFLIQAGAYALIVFTIIWIRFPSRNTSGISPSPLENIKEGIRYVRKSRMTQIFMLMGFMLPLWWVWS